MSKDWYARKLGTAPTTQRRDGLPPAVPGQQQPSYEQPPQPNPYYTPEQPAPPVNARTPYEAAFQQGDAAGGAQTKRLQQKVAQDRCPSCGGPDYLQTGNTVPHCFGCGYNGGRFTHELG